MGNSIHKRRNIPPGSSPPSRPVRPRRGFWSLRRAQKVKTAGPGWDEGQQGLSVHYRAPLHRPENVFAQGTHSSFLALLHSEAQQGLETLRQEELDLIGSLAADSQSLSSSNTLRPEHDLCSLDSGRSSEHGTADSAATAPSTASSTRPVLTRQASTFKPLNTTETLQRPEKTRRKGRRTTIMGIPQQVQRELAQQRSSTFQPIGSHHQPTNGDQQLNDGQSGVVVIPTINGETPAANQEGARVNLSDLEVSRQDQLLRKHLQAVYRDEQLSQTQHPGYHLVTTVSQRPKSLAMPGMTTSPSTLGFLLETQGPVMSISPQATYLSKIIPNAVLPASVEVIQISVRTGRPPAGVSVRAASNSSLVSADSSASPASSRKSHGDGDGDGSNGDHSQTSSTALGSNRSHSRSSSEMPTSDASKRGTDAVAPRAAQGGSPPPPPPESDGGQDHVSVCSSKSWVSSNPAGSPGKSQGSDCEASGSASAQSFIPNLSVVKTKLPPAPPRRTNSLHGNKVRKRSHDLLVVKDLADAMSGAVNLTADALPSQAEVQVVRPGSPKDEAQLVSVAAGNDVPSSASADSFDPFPDCSDGAGGPPKRPSVCSSSQQKSTSERTMSPSSGYSSRSGTPTLSPKEISPESPGKQKRPVKPERSGSRASASSSPGSPSSSLTSLSSTSSDPTRQDVPAAVPSSTRQPSPPSTGKLPHVCFSPSFADREVFNIPPPPRVRAPCAPPPEVWTCSRQSVDLLLGPPLFSSRPVTPKTLSCQSVETQTEAHQGAIAVDLIQASEGSDIVPQEKTMLQDIMETVDQVLGNRAGSCLAPDKKDPKTDLQKEEQRSSPATKDTEGQEKTLKKTPPSVMKKTTPATLREELLCGGKPTGAQHADRGDVRDELVSGHVPTPSLRPEVPGGGSDGAAVKHAWGLENPDPTQRLDRGSPPPSPPPAYNPAPPPSRKAPPSSISIPPSVGSEGGQEEAHVTEASWPPPPPPPLEGDMAFEGGDEVDFPPPPPVVTETLPDVLDGCVSATEQPGAASEEAKLTVENTSSTEVQRDPEEVLSSSTQAGEGRRPPEGAEQCAGTSLDTPCKVLQEVHPVSEVVPPPPKEASPTLSPLTTPERPLSNPTGLPLGSVSPVLSAQTKGPEARTDAPLSPPAVIPQAPSPPVDSKCTPGVVFRRQPSLANRDTRSKEILARHKSIPIPKEDANIPLVTPSLLQMVRLRTVSMVEDEMGAAQTEDLIVHANEGLKSAQEDGAVPASGQHGTPQKPVRKSLSYKSAHAVKASSVTLHSPSMRLQEAIRMKTAAMTPRDCLPSRLGSRLPASSSSSYGEPGAFDPLRSPASTASFIFSRSTKKVVMETASAPEAHAGLKQRLAAELARATERTSDSGASDGQGKSDKVPPPVARKPLHGSSAPADPEESRTEVATAENGGGETEPLAETTTTTVTPDTIETLF